ncbi:MAG TPA: DUF4321 domain-containing protein [Candidatus Avacidaminococcus intestinavium]|uniref:DUF4321 domain-containing protein n=1 Tax=Candidatus Avacidaminococcus intestinavium TaxID=2840684 RepID=A0A9D1SM13_9FIRM|nr:DUF4321 domain-containing protein [Candidatus Avacidaminococcus intestinavium]
MLRNKKGLVFFLFIITGALIGGIIGDVLSSTHVLGDATRFFTQKYEVIKISPATFDFYVLKIMAGFEFQPNLASIIGIIFAIFIFERI